MISWNTKFKFKEFTIAREQMRAKRHTPNIKSNK